MASFVPVEEDASFSVTGSNQNLAASFSSTLKDVYLKMYGSENSNLSYVIGTSNVTPTLPKFMIGKITTSSSNIAPVYDFVLEEGNVGVGVTTPLKKLDVAGDINFVGGLYQNNNLFISSDSTNVVIPNHLGIGTTTPQSKLHVVGDTLVAGHITPTTTETYDLGTSNARFKDIYLAGSSIYLGNTKITHSNAGLVAFQDATTGLYQDIQAKNIITEGEIIISGSISACNLVNSAFIDTTNATNISSGTLNNARLPAAIAVATVSADGSSLSNLNATLMTTGTLANARLPAAIAVTSVSAEGSSLSNLNASLITSGTLANARLPLAFSVSTSVETLIVNNTGLSVVGDIMSTGTVTASNLVILGDTVTMNTVTSNTENMIINNAGTGSALKVIQSGANVVAEFYDAETATPALLIADGGNVGLGTNVPQSTLHIVGNAIATGNIGIGTTTPLGRLHVVGGSSILHNMNIRSFTKSLTTTALGWSSICVVGATHGAFVIYLDVVHSEGGSSEAKSYTIPHQFGSTATGDWYTCLPISTGPFSGNNWRVDVNSDGYNATLRLVRENGGNTANYVCTLRVAQSDANPVTITDLTTTGTGASAIGIFESTCITQVDGNVGIGTTLPVATFDVIGSARITSNLSVASISADGASLSNLNATYLTTGTLDNARLPSAIAVTTLAGDGASLSNLNAAYLTTGTIPNARLPSIISADGSSLSNLNATLITSGTLQNARLPSAIAVTTLAGDGASLSNLNATLLTTGTLANARLPIAFSVATTTQTITINSNSNVGIGTATPTQKLHVEGAIAVTGNILPTSCNVYDLGSSNLRWKDLYLTGSTIDMDGTRLKREAATGALQVVDSNNSYLSVKTGGIYASGSVGIGTTTTSNEALILYNASYSNSLSINSVTDYVLYDRSENYPTLSNVGTTAVSSSGPATSIGSYYYGANNYTTFPAGTPAAIAGIFDASFTIQMWIYTVSPAEVGIPYHIGSTSITTGQNYWTFGLNNGNRLDFYWNHDDAFGNKVGGSTQIPLNTWTHIAATYNVSTRYLSLYINGVAETLGVHYGSATLANATTAYITYSTSWPSYQVNIAGWQSYRLNSYIAELSFVYGSTPSPSLALPKSLDANTKLLLVANQNLSKFVISRLGKMGVGFASTSADPTYQLQVLGESYASSNVYGSKFIGLNAGSSNAPSVTWSSDITTGLYNASNSSIGFVVGGLESTRITSSGNVGIGTTVANYKLHVGGKIFASDSITAYSDARVKTDVYTITNALETVKQLRGVGYKRTDTGEKQIGVIAQEVQSILPEVVSEADNGLSVAYGNLVGLLIEAIKELQQKVSYLESQI